MAKPEYSGPEWQRVRRHVLARDHYLCQIRSHRCRVIANSVDHIVSISRGGARLDPANLQAACVPCNTWKRHQDAERDRCPVLDTGYDWPEPHTPW